MDDLCVSLYVLWDAELIFDAAAEITGHSFMVMIKIIVILDRMIACYRPELAYCNSKMAIGYLAVFVGEVLRLAKAPIFYVVIVYQGASIQKGCQR